MMKKYLVFNRGSMALQIEDAPPELAIPELMATGAKIDTVHATITSGSISNTTVDAALGLIRNGWEWYKPGGKI